tara:strand:+ start:114 stop:299 length:186 start_codon:yes stop_codon:yes gene_type:complete
LDISAPGGDGIITLSAELRSVYRNPLHGLLKMFAKVVEVLRSPRDAVQPDYYYGWVRAIEG